MKTVPVGSFPEGVNTGNGYIYVTNWMDEDMMVLNEEKFDLVELIQLGSNPRNFGDFLFIQ